MSFVWFSGIEDKASACDMLVCYARELKEGFADYAEPVCKLMVPMLKFYFHDGVRTAAAQSLPCLLECGKVKGEIEFRLKHFVLHASSLSRFGGMGVLKGFGISSNLAKPGMPNSSL